MALSWGPAPEAPSHLAAVTIGYPPPDACAAMAAAGVDVSVALGWEALDDLALAADTHPVVIAAVPDDLGHGALERLATILDDHGLEALVAFEASALDAVAAELMDARVALLCDPEAVDWAIALALAAQRVGVVPEVVREGEAERLRRLHEEVARIAAQLAALADEPLSAAGGTVDDRRTRYAAGAARAVPIDPAEIRGMIRARRLRAQFFDPRLVEDPGWDMLLDLFAAELERVRVSVSSLCIASGVAPTTALRWISRMAEAGLMVRVADPGDRRRAFVVLSKQASDAMRGYFGAVKQVGLAFG